MEKEIKALQDSLDVQLAAGNWDADPYMHGMANGMIFAMSILTGKDPEYKDAPEKWNADHLSNLIIMQKELGYVKGEISTVAMLGLVGEAVEVLCEARIKTGFDHGWTLTKAVSAGKEIETLKKGVRNNTITFDLEIHKSKEDLFDKELADNFYYLLALATNRGLTIFDLAQMAHDKVRAKQAAGGSSEDKK